MAKNHDADEVDITALLEAWPTVSAQDRGVVIERLYSELKALAVHIASGERQRPFQPTALVSEAYMRLIGLDRIDWNGRQHFLGVAARIMRQITVDEARRVKAQKRGHALQTTFATDLVGTDFKVADALEIDRVLNELEAVDTTYATIVEARIFAGMTVAETAGMLGVSEPTVKRKWAAARTWLFDRLDNSIPDG